MTRARAASSRTLAVVAYVHYPARLSYFDDWLDAFRSSPALEVVSANLATPVGRYRMRRLGCRADLVILLHSVVAESLLTARRCAAMLEQRRGTLVAFVGNEVNLPDEPIGEKLAVLRSLAPELIGTQLVREAGEYLYAAVPSATVVTLPHALNPDVYQPAIPDELRTIDLGYRGARYLPQIGDDDRNRIIEYFAARRFDPPLTIDIETGFTFGRRRWSSFLNRSRGTIGTESGSRFLRRDDLMLGRSDDGGDHIERRERWSRRVARYLPRGVGDPLRRGLRRVRPRDSGDRSGDVSIPGEFVSGKCISSRHFEAVGTQTCQILFPGRYNDVLEADRHYLSLAPDFSNIDDVLTRFRDDTERRRLVTETRDYILDSHTYRHRVDAVLEAVARR